MFDSSGVEAAYETWMSLLYLLVSEAVLKAALLQAGPNTT